MKQTNINASLFPDSTSPQAGHVESVPTASSEKPQHSFSKPATRADQDGSLDETVEDREKEGKIVLVEWEENDAENPMNWSKGKKWFQTILLCSMTLFVGLATSAYSVGITPMCEEFGVDSEVGQVGMFVFNLAFAVVPLFFAPLSEYYGRNPIYLSCYVCFVLFFIPLALAKNIQTVIIARFFSGCFGAASVTLIGAGLADMWVTSERSAPMALFSFVAVLGTILAPLYTGFILAAKGWRWIEWVQLIVNGAVCAIEILLLRETRGSTILARRAKKLRKETGDNRLRAPSELGRESYKDVLKDSCTKSLKLLVKEPVVLFFSLWISFAWGVMFLFFTVIPLTFEGNHGWKTGVSGLAYLGLVIGTFIGFGTNFYQDYLYNQATKNNNGTARPEARLYSAMLGGILFPVGLWWFSWTQFASVHWIVPILALVPIILGIYCIFLATYNYLTDSYGDNASSAVAAQGFCRNLFAASFPLFGSYAFHGLSYQGFGSLLAGLATLAIPFPFLLYYRGPSIRKRSKYAAATTGAGDSEDKPKGSSSSSNGEAEEDGQNSGQRTAVNSPTPDSSEEKMKRK